MARAHFTGFVHLLSLCLIGCVSNPGNQRVWVSPDKSREVRFVPGPDRSNFEVTPSDFSSCSYYALTNRKTGERLGVAPSVIRDHQLDFVRLQDVHFSPTGQTILIAEDTSDASPVYSYVLLQQADPWEPRFLKLPIRGLVGGFGYGQWPEVERISDTEVCFRYPNDEKLESLRFEEIPDAD
jgi:hypothetical protein